MGFVNDERHHPVLVTTWSGETTLGDVDAYNAWMDLQLQRAQAGGYRLALISDALAVTKTPPEVRRAFSARAIPKDTVAGTWVVSASAFMRGVMAALRWVNPAMADVHMVATLDEALAQAKATLAKK